jgi:hypothetical protein
LFKIASPDTLIAIFCEAIKSAAASAPTIPEMIVK